VKRTICTALAAAALVTAGAVGAAPASAATTNDELVQAWYRVYLGRSASAAASDAGRSYWVGRLDAGNSRETVLDQLMGSREYVSREIGEYYDVYLGRDLDAAAAYWVDGVVQGQFVAEWAAQLVVASDEYYRFWTAGATDADQSFIRSLYYDLLQRSASEAEVSYWRAVLASDGRLAVVRGIWYADEGVKVRVNYNYRTFLGRAADAGAYGYWNPIEVASDHTVRVRLGATDEFKQRH
jgi:hypothetical protein